MHKHKTKQNDSDIEPFKYIKILLNCDEGLLGISRISMNIKYGNQY